MRTPSTWFEALCAVIVLILIVALAFAIIGRI